MFSKLAKNLSRQHFEMFSLFSPEIAVLDLKVTQMLPTEFRVKWPFSSGEEAKYRFSRWLSWWPSWVSDWDDFSNF